MQLATINRDISHDLLPIRGLREAHSLTGSNRDSRFDVAALRTSHTAASGAAQLGSVSLPGRVAVQVRHREEHYRAAAT